MPISIHQLLQQSQSRLNTQLQLTRSEAQFEAPLLLQHVLNVNRAWLIAHDSDILQTDTINTFESLIIRRLNGEPIAYILGYREFYGLHLKVTAETLIPRADTETLVTAALAKLPSQSTNAVLDLGTGSGAIALAIAVNRPYTQLTALDASPAALQVAAENAKNLSVNNVRFTLSDWFSALNLQKFDLIVSNPPYIKQTDAHLKQGDLRFEPLSALASGEDGLNDIRHIIELAPNYLKQNGWLMLEHGYDQANQVAELLSKTDYQEISHAKDLAGILRVTIARYVVV